MVHPFKIIFSDEITYEQVSDLLKRIGATLVLEDKWIGTLSYETNHVWVYMSNDKGLEEKEKVEELLGAPLRGFLALLANQDDPEITYQMVYDFAYLCMQHFHCVIDDAMGHVDDKEFVTGIYEERRFTTRVPMLHE